jgi:hypothetical protein
MLLRNNISDVPKIALIHSSVLTVPYAFEGSVIRIEELVNENVK